MNIQSLGYRKYYKVLMDNRICNYNKGMVKNRFFWGGRLGGMSGLPVDPSTLDADRQVASHMNSCLS